MNEMKLKDLTYYEVSRLYPRLESIDVRVEGGTERIVI